MHIDVLDDPPTQNSIDEVIAFFRCEINQAELKYKTQFRRGLVAFFLLCGFAYLYSWLMQTDFSSGFEFAIMYFVLFLITAILFYGYFIKSERDKIIAASEVEIRELAPCSFSDALERFARRNTVVQTYIEKLTLMNRRMTLKEYMALYYFGEHYTHYVLDGVARPVISPSISENIKSRPVTPDKQERPTQPVRRKISVK